MPSLTQYQYAIALAEAGEFVAAAKGCHVSQPTLSMQIRKLEEELDLMLFDRSQKPIRLTEKGQELLPYMQHVLTSDQQLHEYLAAKTGAFTGEFAIGMIPTIAPMMGPPFVKSFLKNLPKVDLKFQELTTNQCIEKILSGQLDCALVSTPLFEKKIREHFAFAEPFYVYFSSQSELAFSQKSFFEREDIDNDKLVLLGDGHCLSTQVETLCQQGQVPALTTASLSTLVHMVDSGPWHTLLPETAIRTLALPPQKLLPFGKTPVYRNISLVTMRDITSGRKKMILEALNMIRREVPESLKRNKPSKPLKPIKINSLRS